MKHRLVLVYPVLLFIYSIYSFSQTTPNLVLSSNPLFWQFQQQMWQLGYHNRPLSTLIFLGFVLGVFGMYLYILDLIRKKKINVKEVLIIFGLAVIALFPSYPALSNDIFNYLMNAKMMHVYNASPYTHAAWDFPDDPWPKFMTNVHTTTPYGYVWTAIGYVVYGLTFGDLQLGMLGFRLVGVIATVAIGWSVWVMSKRNLLALALFCLNPLVLLEGINNAHNDITMMALFMTGLAIFQLRVRKHNMQAVLLLAGLWLASVYTKLITVIAPMVYLGYMPLKKSWKDKINIYDVSTLAFTAVMYADGAKRYFSWYLLWALPLWVLSQHMVTKLLLFGFSLGGLLSYLPYLYTGDYTQSLSYIRYGFFFAPGLILAIGYYVYSVLKNKYETK
jgi:hypothetical protein